MLQGFKVQLALPQKVTRRKLTVAAKHRNRVL